MNEVLNNIGYFFKIIFPALTLYILSSINGVPACSNELVLRDILRGEWNFSGYVVSDEGAIENQITFHHYYNNTVDAAAGSVNAGCNLELSGNLSDPVFMRIGN